MQERTQQLSRIQCTLRSLGVAQACRAVDRSRNGFVPEPFAWSGLEGLVRAGLIDVEQYVRQLRDAIVSTLPTYLTIPQIGKLTCPLHNIGAWSINPPIVQRSKHSSLIFNSTPVLMRIWIVLKVFVTHCRLLRMLRSIPSAYR